MSWACLPGSFWVGVPQAPPIPHKSMIYQGTSIQPLYVSCLESRARGRAAQARDCRKLPVPASTILSLGSFLSTYFSAKQLQHNTLAGYVQEPPPGATGWALLCRHNILTSNRTQGAVQHLLGFLVAQSCCRGERAGLPPPMTLHGCCFEGLETGKWLTFMTWVTDARAGTFLKEDFLTQGGILCSIQSHSPSAEGKIEDTGPWLQNTTFWGSSAWLNLSLMATLWVADLERGFGPRASSNPAGFWTLGDGITPINDFSYSGKELTFNQASTYTSHLIEFPQPFEIIV